MNEQLISIAYPEGHHEECPLSSKEVLFKEDMDDCECPEDERGS